MRRAGAAVLAVLCLCGSGCGSEVESSAVAAGVLDPTAVYPSDISPPPGTQYPCALTALPRELAGVPRRDREYINRTYARVLRATQAKLVLLKALQERAGIPRALDTYLASTGRLVTALRGDVIPEGLEAFHADVIGAIELQQRFFKKAADVRTNGGSMEAVYEIAEGRQASKRLFAAWGRMTERYPEWDEKTKDSIYHHLCALDLF
jgi:hypothetical protein